MSLLAKKSVALIVGITVVVVGAGAAFAYWTNAGAGADTASTGTNIPIVVNQVSTVAGMAPGVAAQALSGNFDNDNAGPVYVAGVTATVTGTDKIGCTAADYTIAGVATVATQILAGDGVGAWSGLTIQFNNKAATNQDACKNAIVNIKYVSN